MLESKNDGVAGVDSDSAFIEAIESGVDAIIHAFDEDGDRELCQIEIRALQVPSSVLST